MIGKRNIGIGKIKRSRKWGEKDMLTIIISVGASATISYLIAAKVKKETLKMVNEMCEINEKEINEVKAVSLHAINTAVNYFTKDRQ